MTGQVRRVGPMNRVSRYGIKGRLNESPVFDALSGVVLAFLLTLILLTFPEYGISWDEPAQREIGRLALSYYTSGFRDRRAVDEAYFNKIYGGFFEMCAEAAVQALPKYPYETRHLINALAGFIGIVGCWRLSRHLGGRLAAFIALLMMAGFPSYLGHMFNNPKDIPFAAGYIWSVYFMIRGLGEFPKFGPACILQAGFGVGITAGIRVGGLVLIPMACVGWGFYLFLGWMHNRSRGGMDLLRAVLSLAAIFGVAAGIMLVFWPWAQLHPLRHPARALSFFSNWNGQSGDPMYLFECLAVKLPELILVGLLCTLLLTAARARAVLSLLRSTDRRDWTRLSAYVILGASFVLPILYITARRSVLYNEMRQVIFLSLPMVVCGAVSISHVLRSQWKGAWIRPAASLTLAGLLLMPVYSVARLYPYHYIYCNSLAGGLSALGSKFTYEYYLHSYRELAFQLRNYLAGQGAGGPGGHPLTVFAHGSAECLGYYLPAGVEVVASPHQADFAVFSIGNYVDTRAGKEIGRVSRCGVVLSTLRAYERR